MIARQFARIHREKLVNFGVLPLVFLDPGDYDRFEQGDFLEARDLHRALRDGAPIELEDYTRGFTFAGHALHHGAP